VKLYLYTKHSQWGRFGRGSADAAFTITTLNKLFSLHLEDERLKQYADQLGSDCAFFIKNLPMFGSGKGNILSDIQIDLSGYYLLIIKPPIHIASAEAFQMVSPKRLRDRERNLLTCR